MDTCCNPLGATNSMNTLGHLPWRPAACLLSTGSMERGTCLVASMTIFWDCFWGVPLFGMIGVPFFSTARLGQTLAG